MQLNHASERAKDESRGIDEPIVVYRNPYSEEPAGEEYEYCPVAGFCFFPWLKKAEVIDVFQRGEPLTGVARANAENLARKLCEAGPPKG